MISRMFQCLFDSRSILFIIAECKIVLPRPIKYFFLIVSNQRDFETDLYRLVLGNHVRQCRDKRSAISQTASRALEENLEMLRAPL